MKKFLLFCTLFISSYSFSQDTIYVDKNLRETSDTTTAIYYRVQERSTTNPDTGFNRSYWMSGQLKLEEYFLSFKERTREGKRKMWREDGSLWVESNYEDGELDGLSISYWGNGQLKRKDLYQKGKLKEKKVWDVAGNEVEWYPMETRARFPGGKKGLVKYLRKNVQKPAGVAGGKVIVEFVIDVDGSVTDVRIKESSSPALNLAAYNAVSKMPDWQPGQQDGKPIRVNLTLPLTFPDN